MRRARRASTIARPTSWLIVVAGLTIYAALVWAFPATRGWPESPLLWWLAQGAVPIVYGILVGVFLRGVSWPRLLGTTALLWAGHVLVGALTGGVSEIDGGATLPRFPPPPLPQLLWVPLLLIPFHDVITGDPRARRKTGGGRDRIPVPRPGSPTAVRVSTADATAVPAGDAALSGRPATEAPERRGEAGAAAHAESAAGRIGARPSATPASATTVAGTPPARQALDEMLARESSAEVLRVSFARIADQLPAAAFKLPLERMAASLLEPGYLLVPLRLVLTQLGEGLVRTGWETVADQFPRHQLALNDAEITRRLREGQLVLPLDELVPQLPRDLFRATSPLVDLQGIERFPEPFKPADSGREESPAAPVTEPASLDVADTEAVADVQAASTTSDRFEDEDVIPVGGGMLAPVELAEPGRGAHRDAEPVAATARELVEGEPTATVAGGGMSPVGLVGPARAGGGDTATVAAAGRELVEGELMAADSGQMSPAELGEPGRAGGGDSAPAWTTAGELVEGEPTAAVAGGLMSPVGLVEPGQAGDGDAATVAAAGRELVEGELMAADNGRMSPVELLEPGRPGHEDAASLAATERPDEEGVVPVGAGTRPMVELPWRGPEDAESVVAPVPEPELPRVAGDGPEVGKPESREVPAHVDQPAEEPSTRSIVTAPLVELPNQADLAVALEAAGLLAAVGPLNADVETDDDGVTLLCLSSPGLSPTAMATARLMLPALADSRAPWPIEQMTLRGPGGALVLTPLRPGRCGDRVLVAAVPPQGSLALLEILCRRVAARHGSHAGPPLARAACSEHADLLEGKPSARMRDIGASFAAVGPVLPAAFHDSGVETVLCLFLSAESPAQAIAGFAHDLGRAMRKAGASGMSIQTAGLEGRGRRLMLRLSDPARGRVDIIVVVGDRIDRPGLTYRQLGSAADALRAG